MVTVFVDKSSDLTTYTVSGDVTGAEVIDALVEAYSHAATKRTLWDARSMKDIQIDHEMMGKVVSLIATHSSGRAGGKSALVTDNDEHFAMAQKGESMSRAAGMPLDIKCFRDFDEAMAWVKAD